MNTHIKLITRARIKKSLGILFCLVICFGGDFLTAGHASAAAPLAVIGMPFSGQWAWNTSVMTPYPPYVDSCPNGASNCPGFSSHPSVHHTPGGGDWATDIYAAEGTAVKLDVPAATGALTFSWKTTSTSCGQSTGINIIVDGTAVGWLYFAHLNNAVTSGTITNGMTLGTVHDWMVNGVHCNPGVHVHTEFKNTANYSCYVDNGAPGVTLSYGDNFAVVGSSNTGAQQACTSIPRGGYDTPGITRDDGSGNLLWLERNYNSSGLNDVPNFTYGSASTDTSLTGDWNNDGYTTPAIVRNDGSGNLQWLERNYNSTGTNDVTAFNYGQAGDIPVTGDWNGDGFTTPGVVRNENGTWHFLLHDYNSGGSADVDVAYGNDSTDLPVVGDWNGDGYTTIGVVRPNGANQLEWFLRNYNSSGPNDVPYFAYGTTSTDKPITGDWDADGYTTPGVVRSDGSGNLQWLERNYNSAGDNDVPAFTYGSYSTDRALVGDWDNH